MSAAQKAFEKRRERLARERDDDDADIQPSDEEPACEECGAELRNMHYCGTCNAYACDDCLEYNKKSKKWCCHPNLKFTDCAKKKA